VATVAEGLLGGILGGEDEKSEVEAPEALAGAEAFGAAIAAIAAQSDAERATELSPRHADAWKLWGDVLAKSGHGEEALAKYDEALKYAPNWKQLRGAREATAKRNM
jgi:tetratricopeptide (TPR) repeat protein